MQKLHKTGHKLPAPISQVRGRGAGLLHTNGSAYNPELND